MLKGESGSTPRPLRKEMIMKKEIRKKGKESE
jgi:hypothetical protein